VAKLVIATGHNNAAMNGASANRAALRAGRARGGGHAESGGAVVRTFDSRALSCSTHAMGRMPRRWNCARPDGSLIREVRRG